MTALESKFFRVCFVHRDWFDQDLERLGFMEEGVGSKGKVETGLIGKGVEGECNQDEIQWQET